MDTPSALSPFDTYFEITDIDFALPYAQRLSAARAIRRMAPDFVSAASLVDARELVTCLSVDDVLAQFGWKPSCDGGLAVDQAAVTIDDCWSEDHTEQDVLDDINAWLETMLVASDALFTTIAPSVQPGSRIVIEDCFGRRRAWLFDGSTVTIEGVPLAPERYLAVGTAA